MPKKKGQSAFRMLKRWIQIDHDLHTNGLLCTAIAHRFKVDKRTIRRDLAAFRKLRKRIVKYRYDWEIREHWFKYEPRGEPLFTCNRELSTGSGKRRKKPNR